MSNSTINSNLEEYISLTNKLLVLSADANPDSEYNIVGNRRDKLAHDTIELLLKDRLRAQTSQPDNSMSHLFLLQDKNLYSLIASIERSYGKQPGELVWSGTAGSAGEAAALASRELKEEGAYTGSIALNDFLTTACAGTG